MLGSLCVVVLLVALLLFNQINEGPSDGGKPNPNLTHAFMLCEDIWCCIPKIRFHQADIKVSAGCV